MTIARKHRRTNIKRWHPSPRKIEVICTEKRPPQIWRRLSNLQSHLLSDIDGIAMQAAAFTAFNTNITRFSNKIHAIKIQVGRRFSQRPWRIGDVSCATQQILLFCCRPEKYLRPLRRMLHSSPRHSRYGNCHLSGSPYRGDPNGLSTPPPGISVVDLYPAPCRSH